MQHAGQADVVDIVAAAADEARILLAEHPAVPARFLVVVGQIFRRLRAVLDGRHALASSCAFLAAHCTERTIVV